MYEADFQLELAAIEAEYIGRIPLVSGAYYGVAFGNVTPYSSHSTILSAISGLATPTT